MRQHGFTLLEVLVSLAIVATVLVVFVGRLGASANLQREIRLRSQALEIGTNVLEQSRMQSGTSEADEGEEQIGDDRFVWKTSSQAGPVAGLIQQQVVVTAADGVQIQLSLYRATP